MGISCNIKFFEHKLDLAYHTLLIIICFYSMPFREVAAAEDEPVEQAAAARRERLKALREAKELMGTPDQDSAQNGSKAEDSEENEEDK